MLKIYQAESADDRAHVRELFWEYLVWANAGLNQAFGINFPIEQMLEADMQTLDKFYPPQGRLLLAEFDTHVAGLACMKQIREGIGEIKRMYVRDQFRGQGIGRALVAQLIDAAREIGYAHLRLDSARFMHAAHSLYRSVGFTEIDPYPESEIPAAFQANWIFMERDL
jgi:GNAT superfamily N-acetyltransferase